MEWFEKTALGSFMFEITIWRRYVNDTIVILCESLLEEFATHINSIHEAIQFTHEKECEGTIAMLEVKIQRQPTGKLSFSVYRKNTHRPVFTI